MAALLETAKPEYGGLDGLPDRQQAVIPQQTGLLVPQVARDILALLFGQHDAVKLLIDDVVVVKGARVLCRHVELSPQGAEGAPVDRVAVRRTEHVRSGLVDGRVDHVRRGIQQSARAAVNHLAGVVDQDQVTLLDQREGHAERVDPEGVGVDGVAERDVAGHAFVKAQFAEDAEGEREAAFEVFALGVLVLEFGRGGEFHRCRCR